jgi:PD-(D/E)XK endonuclease
LKAPKAVSSFSFKFHNSKLKLETETGSQMKLETLPHAPKARGELAEARFIAKALSVGLRVARPFGDSSPYDFIVERNHHLYRVQVKSAWRPTQRGAYQFVAGPAPLRGYGLRPYRPGEIDFLVLYIAPDDTWFIIPAQTLGAKTHLTFRTDAPGPFAPYREAWDLLK